MNSKKQRQEWWGSLTPQEKSKFISYKERDRRSKRVDRTGTIELLPLGLVKVWTSVDSFTVYKPDMVPEPLQGQLQLLQYK